MSICHAGTVASDQGRQFESILIAEICKILHIRKTRTTPYHPQEDGMVERFNRTLVNMLATSISELGDDSWEEHLPKLCLAYNTFTHPTTGETPFFLMHGRQARLPVDLMYGSESTGTSVPEYAKELGHKLSIAFEQTRKRTGNIQQRQRELYDKHIDGLPFEADDLVWLHNPAVQRGECKTFHRPWSGPYKVVKRHSESTYRIKSVHNSRKRVAVHFDRLKKCAGGMRLQSGTCPSEPSAADSDTPPAPNHHPADGMEVVEDMDDPRPGEHLHERQPADMPADDLRKYRNIMKTMHPKDTPQSEKASRSLWK